MNDFFDEFPLRMASCYIEDEAWVQCWLRLTMRFQAEVGIPFDGGDPEQWCQDMKVEEVLWDADGEAVRNAMGEAELNREFQDEYELLLDEFDHHQSSFAHRLAFNQLMDDRWEQLKEEALNSLRLLAGSDQTGR